LGLSPKVKLGICHPERKKERKKERQKERKKERKEGRKEERKKVRSLLGPDLGPDRIAMVEVQVSFRMRCLKRDL